MEIYIENETYNRLVAALLTLQPCPITGEVGPDQIKIALGEVADIWPESIRVDVAENNCAIAS